MGSGLGLAYLPITGLVSKHFTKRRALAMGINTTGTSVGGFTIALVCSKLFRTSLSFPWTVRIVAFTALGCNLAGNLLLSNPRVTTPTPDVKSQESVDHDTQSAVEDTKLETLKKPQGKGSDDGKDADQPRKVSELLRDPAYLAIITSVFFAGLGLYFPM